MDAHLGLISHRQSNEVTKLSLDEEPSSQTLMKKLKSTKKMTEQVQLRLQQEHSLAYKIGSKGNIGLRTSCATPDVAIKHAQTTSATNAPALVPIYPALKKESEGRFPLNLNLTSKIKYEKRKKFFDISSRG